MGLGAGPVLRGITFVGTETGLKFFLGGGGSVPRPGGEKNRSSSIFIVAGEAGDAEPERPMCIPPLTREESELRGGERGAKG